MQHLNIDGALPIIRPEEWPPPPHPSGCVDAGASAYLSGYFTGQASFGPVSRSSLGNEDLFVAKLSPDGKFLWATSGGGSWGDRAYGLAVDGSGAVYLTGEFTGSAGFGGTQLSSQGGTDVFVWKLIP